MKKNFFKIEKDSLTAIIIIVFLAITGLFFELVPQKADADFIDFEDSENSLLIYQDNSLFPVSEVNLPDPEVIKEMKVVVTAYSSSPFETYGNPFITASGSWVRDGIIANNLLSFGTKVRIPEIFGDKIFVVEDRMSRKKGDYHIDIWFPERWQALDFGAKRTYIEVLES